MPVPRNTSSLLAKLQNAKGGKKPEVKPAEKKPIEQTETLNDGGNAGREAAKLRQRAKKAEGDLQTITAERDTLKAENDALKPKAKQWDDYEHVQRSKIVQTLPPELQKEAKTMSLGHLQLFAKNMTGAGGEGGKGKSTETAEPGTLEEARKAGKLSEYVEKVKKGEVAPVMGKPEAAAA